LQQNKCSELVDKFAPVLNTDDDVFLARDLQNIWNVEKVHML